MNTIIEGDIQIDFSKALSYRKFDSPEHGLSHCMKAVDFIVELKEKVLFIEIKDPQHPSSNRTETDISKYLSGKLIKKSLVPKCRDSFLYELSAGNISKPVYYYVLVCLDTLQDSELTNLNDLLSKNIPVTGPPNKPWPNRFINECSIFNLRTWNKHLTIFPAKRISEVKET